MATLLWHLPFLMQTCPHGPAVARLAQAANAAGFTVGNHFAWAASIERPHEAIVETPHQELGTRANDTIAQQQAVIHELVAMNKAFSLRVATVKAHVGIGAAPTPPIAMLSHEAKATVPTKHHKAVATSLADLWFEWYARDPPIWQKSEAKLVVGFMKLFLHNGLELDANAPSYRDDVLRLGSFVDQRVLSFVPDIVPNVRSSGSVLRILREQHRIGTQYNHWVG
ncbi:hypothetical protein H257_10704 [Aphanomyces astaci]|uniref:Uncharacterized protein n=1 Tax=Aphanomyces astaci TaxID=112090 RepID=W4G4G8_APHAT|nr:hypothetical protein H257_10704 [Aphanomyces astaci]ETV74555.1 hypothetical protein H257_10704 [Aphanomyces astaci]|eukprot:XP_009835642.1 hypothetical protein H257_10704 [Aphanomyces astaci]